MPDALLKLLVKDKPLYSGKVRERRETKPPRGTRLEQMRDRQAAENSEERAEDNYSRQGPTSTQSLQLKPEVK